MSDTLVNLRTRVRSRIDETTATYWQDSELTAWINEAAREVARRSENLQTTSLISSVANQQEYTLPADMFRVHRVEFARTSSQVVPLEYRDFNNMDSIWWSSQRITPGDPYWYTMWGFPPACTLIVYPTPSDSIANAFKVFYYRLPATASADSDPVEIPAGWDDVIVDYCEYSALRKDGDSRWQEAKGIFEDKMNHMVDSTRRWTDAAGSYSTGSGPLPAWIWGGGDYY
jgi:Family of unknown function (DUF6682)